MTVLKKSAIALLCMVLLGCGGNDSTKTQETTTSTSSTTSTDYVALTDIPYPPFEFSDGQGGVMGMEIDIFNAIAKQQGFSVKYEPHLWDGIFDKLNSHEATFIVSAVGVTEEAKSQALLSTPYMTSSYRVTTLDSKHLKNWQSSKKIAVSEDEDAYDDVLIKMGIKPEQLNIQPSIFKALTAMVRGEVDVVVADSSVLKYYANSESFVDKVQFLGKDLPAGDESNIAFAVDKSHPELLEKVNQGLEQLKASGELEQILKKYNQ